MRNGLYKPASQYADDGIACLRMYNIDNGRIAWRDVKRMRLTADELRQYQLLPGDLLVNRVNSRELVGKSALIPAGLEPIVFESKNIRLRIRKELAEPAFLNYCLLAAGSQYFNRNAQQVVGMASISQPQVARFPVPLPPLDCQRKIVAELDTQFTRLDSGVAALVRVQANVKRYRAAVLRAACEGRLVPTEAELAHKEGRSYETGAELLERALVERRTSWSGAPKYNTPLGPDSAVLPRLPEGWMWTTLDQLLVLLRNGISMKPDADKGLPILRISAVRPLSVNLDDVRYLSAGASEFQSYILSQGDLLFTRYNGNPDLVGVCGVVPAVSSNLVHPDKLIRCRLVQGVVLPRFVAIMSNVGASRDHLAKRVRTTAGQSGISGADLKCLPIPLAPFAEQARIVAEVERRLSVTDELEALLIANRLRASRLRQSVLQRAFEGRLA